MHCENLIPDNVLCQWGHDQTTRALLYKGQFVLIWMTLVLCSEHQLRDFNLRLMQDKEDYKSTPLTSPRHLFSLGYGTMGSKKKKSKGSFTSQRWHFNRCWADKHHMPPGINAALWTPVENNTLCVCRCEGRNGGGGFKMMMSCLQHR